MDTSIAIGVAGLIGSLVLLFGVTMTAAAPQPATERKREGARIWWVDPSAGIHRLCRWCRHVLDDGDHCDYCGGPR